jgi:hypothetical protein
MPRAILTRRVPPSDNQEQQIELAIADHVHLCLRITQMFRVAHTVGLFRGKATATQLCSLISPPVLSTRPPSSSNLNLHTKIL